MHELPMAPARPLQPPAIRLDHLDYIPNLHPVDSAARSGILSTLYW
jgi:hypothetical protein